MNIFSFTYIKLFGFHYFMNKLIIFIYKNYFFILEVGNDLIPWNKLSLPFLN